MARRSKSLPTSTAEAVITAAGVVTPSCAGRVSTVAAFIFGIAVSALVGAILWPYEAIAKRESPLDAAKSESTPDAKPAVPQPELWRIVAMSDEELAAVDIAYLNLLCATGLPGSESLDISKCRETLDHWAALVKGQTAKYLYKYQQNPAEFENQEGYFRMLMLVSVLQQDLRVRYNPDRIHDVNFKGSQDLFIHGMINNQNGGTCVSMPVLYTAVARRLGYPVRLVLAKAHLFCRWDDGTVRLNIEGSGVGMNSFPDEHYYTWPHPMTAPEVERGEYLRSLTPREELAQFLAARGHCLDENGREAEAYVAYAHAYELAPKQPETMMFLRRALRGAIDPEVLARQKGEAGRALSLAQQNDYAWMMRHNQELQEQRDRELNWTPHTPFVPGFPVRSPSFPSPSH
jgi:hypothetical protein